MPCRYLGRIARSISTYRAQPNSADHLPARGLPQRASIVNALDNVEIDCKVTNRETRLEMLMPLSSYYFAIILVIISRVLAVHKGHPKKKERIRSWNAR